jgi:hypothetical protein
MVDWCACERITYGQCSSAEREAASQLPQAELYSIFVKRRAAQSTNVGLARASEGDTSSRSRSPRHQEIGRYDALVIAIIVPSTVFPFRPRRQSAS